MDKDFLNKQIDVLHELLLDLFGKQQLLVKAKEMAVLEEMLSPSIEDRVLAYQKIIMENTSVNRIHSENLPEKVQELEDIVVDLLAKRTIEERIEKKVNDKIRIKQHEYLKEIRAQVLKETSGPDNAYTLRKYAELEMLEQTHLSKSALDLLRPKSLKDVVGQEQAIKALLANLTSPFPQHVIIYGPPGVGKTTVARLALEEAKKWEQSPFNLEAKFVEVDGTTLRWDPKEAANPLLGSVHDPIYQGAKRDFVDGAVPEPKLGLVTEAHGGILFIDEIGELDPILQNKLLKVLEDKRVLFESSYYDPADPNVPKYIHKLFEEGAPADFILIGATTRDPSELNMALRSRCAEIFFEPLTPSDIERIVRQAAKRLEVELEKGVEAIIAEYTIEGRKATRILADAVSIALFKRRENRGTLTEPVQITKDDVREIIKSARLTPAISIKGSDELEVGKIFGLGVRGFLGSIIEIEAIAYKREDGNGTIRFNETAGSMAKDSLFNASAVFRALTQEDIRNYDVHVNIVGGGRIDGPSAGVAMLIAIISAVKGVPIPQNIAVTGEVSLRGNVKPIGSVHEKVFAARQAGIRTVFVPEVNREELPRYISGVRVIGVKSVEEILQYVFDNKLHLESIRRQAINR